jgi:hypothetical protein
MDGAVTSADTMAFSFPSIGYDIRPARTMQTMPEFQNDAEVKIRISRLAY